MRLVEQSVQRDASTKVSEFRTELPRACASGRSDSPRRAAIGRGNLSGRHVCADFPAPAAVHAVQSFGRD